MLFSRALFLLSTAISLFPEKQVAGQHGKSNHIEHGASNHVERYALSEVVIQPKVDILSLSRRSKRQDPPAQALKQNTPSTRTIQPQESQIWVFPASELTNLPSPVSPSVPSFGHNLDIRTDYTANERELKRRDNPTLWIAVDVCSQPNPSGAAPTEPPPPLEFYVSYTADNKNPGPNFPGRQSNKETTDKGGHGNYSSGQQGDTYIGIHAPSLDGKSFSGGWTYQIAASTQDQYTQSHPDRPFMRFVDSDVDSALFVTDRLANSTASDDPIISQWNATGGPFGVFIYNASDPMLAGVNQSYCGLMKYAVAFANVPGNTTNGSEAGIKITNGTIPYQQLYVPQLKKGSKYKAALSLTSRYSREINSNTAGGGGSIWQSVDFQTRLTDNCKVIYNLTFCGDVAYSVPTNKTLKDVQTLGAFYDNFTAQVLWTNFNNSLDQVPCGTSNDAKYSLARNCADCGNAYKSWVCAVAIPRCADFMSDATSLKTRNTNPTTGPNKWPNGTDVGTDLINPADAWNATARNDGNGNFMNQTGPYKEVLPCSDLCYNLVQSCPSSMGFACPLGRQLEWGYAHPAPGRIGISADGYPVCNYPGRLWEVNGSPSARLGSPRLLVVAVVATWFLAAA